MFWYDMELAIPLVALGGLYLISNKKEPFINDYPKPNQLTDKYFQPNPTYVSESDKPKFTDLAGRQVNLNDYSENMVPFFGKTKNIGDSLKNMDHSESVLDHAVGSGSLKITKSENAPLFKPQDNTQWAHGAPNQSDFYQSRVNPSQNMHNVKPFQETHVAPGMNKGYSSQGSGGFNSGTEARDQWIDKTVNELRVATKPKTTFTLDQHEGPAQTLVKNLGIEGKVEKYLPDKFFINSPDRYLTTTGAVLGPTQQALQPDPTIHRATTTKSYTGHAGNGGVQSQAKHGMYRPDNKQQLGTVPFTPAQAAVERTGYGSMNPLVPTNRSFQNASTFGGMGGLISAITAPVTDLLRPTRKEDIVGLTRQGNAGSTVANPTVKDVYVAPTIKQGTMYNAYDAGGRAYAPITDGGYQVSEQQVGHTERETTSVPYMGTGLSVLPQPMSMHADLNASISANRMTHGRIAGGNIQTFNSTINQVTSTNRSATHAPYMGGMGSSIANVSPSAELYGGIRNANKYAEPDRNTSDLLDAFKKNPYTQSLHSVA
jgi:hypothetical protein